MSSRYGEPRRQAQLELRAAAAQFVVDAELMLRWLDQPAGEPAPAQVLEDRHSEVLRRARSLEAALNHLVTLELLAGERPSEALATQRPGVAEESEASGAEPEPKTPSNDPDRRRSRQAQARSAQRRASLPRRARQRCPGARRPPDPRAPVVGLCMTR